MRDELKKYYIYYHNDMDGIGSSILVILFLLKKLNLSIDNFVTIPVDYDLNSQWHTYTIKQPAAILDFLYHPDAKIWFDHHGDPFVGNNVYYDHYKARISSSDNDDYILWDKGATSAIKMIFTMWQDFYKKKYCSLYNDLKNMVMQIDKIDSANFDHVDQWYNCEFEVLKINLVLVQNRNNDPFYANNLLNKLLKLGCKNIIQDILFQDQFKIAQQKMYDSYEIVKNFLEIHGNVVFYNSTKAKNTRFYRFFPYKFKPDAQYTVGIYRKNKSYEVSIGKNPFRSTNHQVDIGKLCSAFGGGGHRNVGGINVVDYEKANNLSNKIIRLLN